MEKRHFVVTLGLTEDEHAAVERNLPSDDCETFATDAASDLVAHGDIAMILRAGALDQDSLDFVTGYCEEVGTGLTETVVWIGEPRPPASLRGIVKFFASFGELEPKLKYLLLESHTEYRKAADYSARIACSIKILLLIRDCPGITTQRLADEVGVSARSVQRYITSLKMAGEWIVYDRAKRGWSLLHGSILLDDDLG